MQPTRRIEERLARRGGAVELLRLPAALFAAVSRGRARLYDRGWLPSERVEAPVISVGNLTAGGTGKTPAVAWFAAELQHRGRRPGIVSRGYGSEQGLPNDEARLLAELLPDVPHVQDTDRARGARSLLPAVDTILLDDGFQHRRLARDLDVVLVDATRPYGLPSVGGDAPVRALLPRGLLRESPSALARANLIVLTRADQISRAERDELARELAEHAPGVPVVGAVHRPVRLRATADGAVAEVGELAGREVDLVSGIGNPEGFEATVQALGASVVEHRRFPDHHPYERRDLEGLGAGGRWVVTTGKDAVKLAPLGLAARALDVELELTDGAPVVAALLDALPESRATRERNALHEGLHG